MNRFNELPPTHNHDRMLAPAVPDLVFEPAASVNLSILWGIIRRNLWWIALVTMVALVSTGVLLHFLPPRFRAETVLQISIPTSVIPNGNSTIVPPQSEIDDLAVNSEVEAVLAVPVVNKVIDQLRLSEDPEFNPALTDPNPSKSMAAYRSDLGAGAGCESEDQSIPGAI